MNVKLKIAIAALLGIVVGAGGVFGIFALREMRRYEAYVEHMAFYEATEYEPALFDVDELYELSLVTPADERVRFVRDSDREVILINFWASWCKPCLDEFGAFEKLVSQTKDRVGFYFLTGEPPEAMESVARQYDLPFYSYESEGVLPPYMRAPELPRTYIIREGKIVYEHRGPAPWNSAKALALLEQVVDGAGVP